MDTITDKAAGVPFVALPPPDDTVEGAPLVVVWHLADPPRSEVAMAAALPLHGLAAWRIFLGLPLSGSRLPGGDLDAFFELGYEDAVLKLFEPMTRQAVAEFPSALEELRLRLPLANGPVALVAASAGTFVALSVLADPGPDLSVHAVALISPALQLSAVVGANERRFGVTYPWSEASLRAADRLDFLARSDEIARSGCDILLVTGELDDEPGIRRPAAQLSRALSERATLVDIPGMAHALAEEPGLEPAPQTAHAARVDATVTEWLGHRLSS
jgi:pimeloyl-ACP methyl ester carboxylesterase